MSESDLTQVLEEALTFVIPKKLREKIEAALMKARKP